MSLPVVPWPESFGFAESVLMEHPGHSDQKVHGRRSGASVGEHPSPFPPMDAAARASHVAGLKELISFHTTEAKRLGAKLGVAGRDPRSVMAELGGMMGGGEPLSGFHDYAKWAAHQEMAIGLGTQAAALRSVGMILSAVRDSLAVSWDGADLLTVLPDSERATVEALTEGDFVYNLREAGFTVMVDQRIVEARLLEHPGHPDQKVHGRRGGGGDLASLDAELRSVRGGERLVGMKDGKVVLDKGGPGTSIQLNHADDMALAGSIASHNHPTGWQHPEGTIEHNGNGPSPPDLETAWRAGVEEMRIVTPGSVYSVKAGSDTTWGMAVKQREARRLIDPAGTDTSGNGYHRWSAGRADALQIISDDVRNEFVADINAGTKTIGQAQMLHYDEVLRRSGEVFGWEVSVTRNSDYVDVMSGDSVVSPKPSTPTQTFDQRFGSLFPGMGQQSQVSESLEKRVARELLGHVVRLLEHPGHGNQKVHGRRGRVDVSGLEHANISAKTQAKMAARAAKLGMPSVDQMAADIGKHYAAASAGTKAAGKDWYENAHKDALALAEANGTSLEQVAGVMAVNSPSRHWDVNKAVAIEMVEVVGKNAPFSIDAKLAASMKVPVKPGIYKPSDLTAQQLSFAHPNFRSGYLNQKYSLSSDARSGYGKNHYRQVESGISVLRGDTTPDMALTAAKTRSFYNNIYDPRSSAVTIDDWAYKAALGPMPVTVRYSVKHPDGSTESRTYSGPATGAPYGTLGSLFASAPHAKAEGYNAGLYPLVGEAYAKAASKAGILPQQMQAIVWTQIRGAP